MILPRSTERELPRKKDFRVDGSVSGQLVFRSSPHLKNVACSAISLARCQSTNTSNRINSDEASAIREPRRPGLRWADSPRRRSCPRLSAESVRTQQHVPRRQIDSTKSSSHYPRLCLVSWPCILCALSSPPCGPGSLRRNDAHLLCSGRRSAVGLHALWPR
jgi:hypothetical protein